MDSENKIGVLFVCLGNICRSPMAEAIFRHLVRLEGIEDRFHIDSAGTGNWHIGERPHRGTQGILDQNQISHEGLRARQVTAGDLQQFRYIVAMDAKNEGDLQLLMQNPNGGTMMKLLDLLPEVSIKDVPDPYYTGNFQEVYELVDRGCRALLGYIRNIEGLGHIN